MTPPPGRADVFISYRHRAPTASWVRGDLVDALEAEGFRVIVDVRDFQPAGILVEEMEEASRRARVTVAVVDETYALSGFTEFERTISPQLVVVAKGAVARDQLPPARLTVDLRDTDDVRPVVDAVHSLITRVYVLEAEQDQAWVEGVLLPALEIADVSVGHSLNVAAGSVKADAVMAAILRADRVVVVLSRAYLRGALDTVVATVDLQQQVEKLLPVSLEAGLDLPTRYTVREVIDATETDRWGAAVARICRAIGVTPPAPPGPPPCPYPGMRPFSDSDEDADLFVGRGPEIAETLAVLRRSRIAVIIGPSGSGKSSLALAGVVPRLRLRGVDDQAPAVVCVMRPGPQPAQAFDQALATVQRIDAVPQPPGVTRARDRVVVIDQLEEAFSPEQRDPRAFISKLVDAHRADPHLHLLVTVRADFVGTLMSDRALWALIAAQRVEVTPLAGDALRDAIRRPARERGVVVEEALVERLASETEGEPGLLPFLQETLRRLWDDLEWRLMTLDSYRQLGRRADGGSGVLEAIRDEAERALAEATALRPDAEAVVRAILLRLVQFGEGAPHTRRQQTLADLEGAAPDAATFEEMFGVLQAHRIITSSAQTSATTDDDVGGSPLGGELQVADLSHEAIIRGWPKLNRWVTTHQVLERDRRRWLQRAQVWSAGQGSLLADHDLSVAQTWATDAAAAGIRVDDPIARHLRASRDRAARSTRRRRVTVLGSVVVLALLATTFGLLAVVQSRPASGRGGGRSPGRHPAADVGVGIRGRRRGARTAGPRR